MQNQTILKTYYSSAELLEISKGVAEDGPEILDQNYFFFCDYLDSQTDKLIKNANEIISKKGA